MSTNVHSGSKDHFNVNGLFKLNKTFYRLNKNTQTVVQGSTMKTCTGGSSKEIHTRGLAVRFIYTKGQLHFLFSKHIYQHVCVFCVCVCVYVTGCNGM